MRESGFRRQCLLGQGELVCAVSHIPRQEAKCTSTLTRTIQQTARVAV